MSEIINVTSMEELKNIVENNETVVADFWAEWCGPCRMFSPLIDQLAAEAENVTVVKVNVDEAPAVAASFGVQSIPTVIAWNGKIENGKGHIGVMPYTALKEFVSAK